MMKPIDTFILSRKAHSATKINQADQISSSNFKTDIKASCASASLCSNRDRALNLRNSKNVFGDEPPESFKSTESRKKLFLYASQVLGKLKKITGKCSDPQNLPTLKNNEQSSTDLGVQKLTLSFRKVNFYYDLLKRLLEERCILLLKEESRSCVKQTQKLVSDLKCLFSHEIIKLTTMPIKSYNHFIDSSGISISVLEQLFKKVNYICDLHSSLKNNYQNIINFFHVGFDMELNQMLLKINKFQNHLYSEMFYWTHKVLEVFILKLCLANPDSVSPEFLHHIVEICESFNLLFFDKKQINYAYLTNAYNDLFSCMMQSDFEAVLLDFTLQYLSHFEAKVAAEKIIQYLIHECKNYEYTPLKEQRNDKDKRDTYITNSNTSDYYSASPTVIEETPNHLHAFINGSLNFESVFLSLLQRNQSLILKYLYSIICLDGSVSSKNNSDVNESFPVTSAVNKAWNLPQSGYKNRNYVCLEEKYWILFWDNVLAFILKLMLEVPCHQYGNAAAGVFLFWPHSYHPLLFKLLKFSMESKDISPSGINVMKKVFHALLIYTMQETWDKNMTSALSMIHSQCCIPIPVAENKARTRIGNALCLCLESLRTSFLDDVIVLDSLQMFYPFQVTLDYFTFLTNTKTRASVSSSDISTYLLISCSDCVYACKLLEESETPDFFRKAECFKYFSSLRKQKDCISDQIEILSGYISEAPTVIYQMISNVVKSICEYKLTRNHWRICNYNNAFESRMLSICSIDEVLSSFINIIDHIYDGISILSAITSAVSTSLFSVLQVMHKNLSLKKVKVIREILSDFLKWLNELNIEEHEQEKLKENKYLKKLLCIIHILESSLTVKQDYFGRINNKITPLIDVTPEECMILTEEERFYWRVYRKNCFMKCF